MIKDRDESGVIKSDEVPRTPIRHAELVFMRTKIRCESQGCFLGVPPPMRKHNTVCFEADFDIHALKGNVPRLLVHYSAMTLRRLLLTTLVLLAQTWPLQAVGVVENGVACGTGCCAWLEEAGMTACACTEESMPPAPAGIPAAGSRELVPPVTWVAASDVALPARPDKDRVASMWQMQADQARGRSAVRLPVLLCSFLN